MAVEPLEYEFTVACSPAHAFETWTAGLDRWWPKDHRLTGTSDSTMVMEGGVDGRILEIGPDGSTELWGRITRWEPAQRLGYDWLVGQGDEHATAVDVTFTAVTPEKTQITIVHSGWERFGDDRDDRMAGNRRGWAALIAAIQTELA